MPLLSTKQKAELNDILRRKKASQMSKQEDTPRLPEVGEYVRMKGRLVEVQDVTPKPPPKEVDYIFEDTNARVELRINGKRITEYGTFNNFYGADSCVPSAIEEAKKLMANIGPSDAELVVVKITSQRRMRPRGDREHSLYAPQFIDFQTLSHGACSALPDDTEEVVWSSKKDI